MIKNLVFILVVSIFLSGCFVSVKTVKTPAGLASYYHCDPLSIGGWMDGMIKYHLQQGYADGATVMQRRWGDCKGYAVVANEALNSCPGIKSHLVKLTHGRPEHVGHVITVFTLADGQKGFINAGQVKIYPRSVPWSEIIKDVRGGPWYANFSEE